MKKIAIVGGYGDVGKHTIEELLSITNRELIVAGRNIDKAKACIDNIGNPRLESMHLDIYTPSTYKKALSDIEIVIMCLQPQTNEFALYCLKEGIHYIDISPSNQVIGKLAKQYHDVKEKKATCILGVGICPGLSTLLVKDTGKEFEEIVETDITLLLGMGDAYGKDAIQWLLDNLHASFMWEQNNNKTLRKPFFKKTQAHFDSTLGKRFAYAFNLSDQQIVTETLSHKNVSTYFCYDKKSITKLVYIFYKIGFFKLLRYRIVNAFILNTILKVSTLFTSDSSDVFSINVKIVGYIKGELCTKIQNIRGNNSAQITGKVAAQTARELLEKHLDAGVLYVNEILDLREYSITINKSEI